MRGIEKASQGYSSSTGAVFVIVAALAMAGCFRAAGQAAPGSRGVSAAEYGDRWPLTVERGLLKCTGAMEVVFVAPGGIEYALNGQANNKAGRPGDPYRKVEEIWAGNPDSDPSFPLKKSIGPLIDDGLKLCE